MAVNEDRSAKLLREAEYKEMLAIDVERAGGWQGPLLREKAALLREEAAKCR